MITKFFNNIYEFLISWGEAIYEYRNSNASRTYHHY